MDISKINKNAKISGRYLSVNSKKISISSDKNSKSTNDKKVHISPAYEKTKTKRCGGCSRRRRG